MKALNVDPNCDSHCVGIEATEIDAPSIDSLLTGARVPEHHIRVATECNHDRIQFVAGSGFQCAHCAADLADLD